MAVSASIDKQENSDDKIAISLKYQVLCKETAIVGVQKQTDSATGEMKESTIKFGKSELGGFQEDYEGINHIMASQMMFSGPPISMCSRAAPMMKMCAAPMKGDSESDQSSDEDEKEDYYENDMLDGYCEEDQRSILPEESRS